MRTNEAVKIARNNPEFKHLTNKCLARVENGDSNTSAFNFVVDGQQFAYGFESIYDETIPDNEIVSFCRSLGRVRCRNGRAHYVGTVKPLIIR